MLRIQKNIRQNYDRGEAAGEAARAHFIASYATEASTAHGGAPRSSLLLR